MKLVLCFLTILFFSGSCFCAQTTSHLQEPAEKTERVFEKNPLKIIALKSFLTPLGLVGAVERVRKTCNLIR